MRKWVDFRQHGKEDLGVSQERGPSMIEGEGVQFATRKES